jgi:hypothetical protein
VLLEFKRLAARGRRYYVQSMGAVGGVARIDSAARPPSDPVVGIDITGLSIDNFPSTPRRACQRADTTTGGEDLKK